MKEWQHDRSGYAGVSTETDHLSDEPLKMNYHKLDESGPVRMMTTTHLAPRG